MSCDLDNKLISSEDYEAISLLYSTPVELMKETRALMLESAYQIAMMDNCIPEVDLLNSFWSAYQIQTNNGLYHESLLRAVKALNAHIILRGGYKEINEYLSEKGLVVTENWQMLSKEVGFKIDDSYVTGFSSSWSTWDSTWFDFSSQQWYYIEV